MKKQKEEITIKDVKIVGGDFFEDKAKDLAKHPNKLKKYIAGVNEAYRQTGDPDILTTALEIIAMVKVILSNKQRKQKCKEAQYIEYSKKVQTQHSELLLNIQIV